MKPLTKDQKIQGLTYAYLSVLGADGDWIDPHICDNLVGFLHWYDIHTSRMFLWEYFPEFTSQRPRRKDADSKRWETDKRGNLARLRAIERAINLVEKSKR